MDSVRVSPPFRCTNCLGMFTAPRSGFASAHVKSCVIRHAAPPELAAMREAAAKTANEAAEKYDAKMLFSNLLRAASKKRRR